MQREDVEYLEEEEKNDSRMKQQRITQAKTIDPRKKQKSRANLMLVGSIEKKVTDLGIKSNRSPIDLKKD